MAADVAVDVALGGDDPWSRSVPLQWQPGSAPAAAAASGAAQSGFLPRWREKQDGSVAGTLRYCPVVPSGPQQAAARAQRPPPQHRTDGAIVSSEHSQRAVRQQSDSGQAAAQTAVRQLSDNSQTAAQRSPSQPLLEGQNSVEMTPWRRLPRLQVSGRTNSFTQMVAQHSGCFNGGNGGRSPTEPRLSEPQCASGELASTPPLTASTHP